MRKIYWCVAPTEHINFVKKKKAPEVSFLFFETLKQAPESP